MSSVSAVRAADRIEGDALLDRNRIWAVSLSEIFTPTERRIESEVKSISGSVSHKRGHTHAPMLRDHMAATDG